MKDGTLYQWFFHFNHFTEQWTAVPRDERNNYLNGTCENCISADNINTCIEVIKLRKKGKQDV